VAVAANAGLWGLAGSNYGGTMMNTMLLVKLTWSLDSDNKALRPAWHV
jgi:hypothetical protein